VNAANSYTNLPLYASHDHHCSDIVTGGKPTWAGTGFINIITIQFLDHHYA